MAVFQGTSISRGIAIGPAFLYRPATFKVPTRKVSSAAAELARFEDALGRMRGEMRTLEAALPPALRAQAEHLLQAQDLLLADPALVDRTRGAILEGRPAEFAWKQALDDYLAIFAAIQDADMRARSVALGDLGRQVLAALLGVPAALSLEAAPGAVAVAAMLGPTDFVRLAAQPLAGLCLGAGSLLSAAAEMARRLEIPTVVGLGDTFLRQVQPGNTVVVDGGTGLVEVEPEAEAVAYYRNRQRLLQVAAPAFDVTAPALTADGWRVDVRAELERPAGLVLALAQGAEGIGLARSDFVFVSQGTLPTENEQEAAYRDLLAQVPAERRVYFCTLAVGAEESLPFPVEVVESSPLLGLRGVRLSLAYLSAFREQLRALLRAAAGRPLGLAFPMLETISELRASQEWVRRAQLDLEHAGVPYCRDVAIALLVQTPLALLCLEPLLVEAAACYLDLDRLAEYLLACDRHNRRVAHLFRPLHPAILRLVDEAIKLVHRKGKRIDVCGEAAGQPGAIPLLLGLGVDGFCLPADRIAAAKRLIRTLAIPDSQQLAEAALRLASAAEVEALVEGVIDRSSAKG